MKNGKSSGGMWHCVGVTPGRPSIQVWWHSVRAADRCHCDGDVTQGRRCGRPIELIGATFGGGEEKDGSAVTRSCRGKGAG